ncbi:toll-like receptor 1 [Anguilla anguilla]|uniref:toll-like receptor 1 n=1 Tax=Anguilla anguilla TaxID=7936 RepID=UPI0015A7DD5A|nr:toll-like receptor 1 [Anguilla anguilla]
MWTDRHQQSTANLRFSEKTAVWSAMKNMVLILWIMSVSTVQNTFASDMQRTIQDLSFQNLTSVPKGLSPSIEALDLSHNRIQRLTYDDFSTMSNLRFLNVSWNIVKEINPDTFRSTSYLEYLDLSHNKLQNLQQQDYLLFTPKLQFLDLTFNNFSTMTLGEMFNSLKELQNMGLSAEVVKSKDFGSIADIHLQNMFLQLENLTTYESNSLRNILSKKLGIVLSNRPTDEALITDALSAFDKVDLVGLNGSQTYLSTFLRQSKSIRTSHLYLTNIEMTWPVAVDLLNIVRQSTIKHLSIYMITITGQITPQKLNPESHLQSFSIKGVTITNFFFFQGNIYDFFINMRVERLTLAETSLIQMTCPNAPSPIKFMDFSDNAFSDSIFSVGGTECVSLQNLNTLILKGNRVQNLMELSRRLQYMTSLQHLDVSFNSLFYSDTLGNCHWPSSIVHLNLSSNSLGKSVFSCLPLNIETLDMHNNQIEALPDRLFHLDMLTYLDLSSNQLLDVPSCRGFTNLAVFLLRDNSLHTPSMRFVASCPRLREMDVRGNPFMCTCGLREFAALQQRHPIKLLHWPRAYSCKYPEAWRDKLLRDFRLPAISCSAGFLAAAILCPAVAVAVATLVLCKRLDVPWYLRMTWQWTRAKRRTRRREDLEGVHFHAFVSYSQQDADWVNGRLLPGLEEGGALRICHHERNFVPGKTIVENIVRCVERSYRCIFVLSSHFVRSSWCHYELYFAQHQRLSRGSDSVILVLREPLPQYLIPSKFYQLKAMMARRTYLEWPQDPNKQRLFWAHLRAALQAPLPPAPLDQDQQPLIAGDL